MSDGKIEPGQKPVSTGHSAAGKRFYPYAGQRFDIEVTMTEADARPGSRNRVEKWLRRSQPVRFPLIILLIAAPLFWGVTGAPESMLVVVFACGATAMINILNQKLVSPKPADER